MYLFNILSYWSSIFYEKICFKEESEWKSEDAFPCTLRVDIFKNYRRLFSWEGSWNDAPSHTVFTQFSAAAEAATKTPEELLLGAETKKMPLLLRGVPPPTQQGKFSLAQEPLVLILQGSEQVKQSLPLVQK